ncbi:MAG: Microtubule-associated protein, microtubule dynamics during spindle orientation [Caeruleum heppii]|nr:MAG: Microtubule-associated protein, microtubule dynamics during spindle orientation [Caeruleum heppii]
MAEQEEDFSSLPLPDRFQHKVWKVRKAGYEDAAQAFQATPDESDPAFKPFLQDPGLWKAAVADSNVAAQQEGIVALCAFLKFGGPQACTRTRNQTVTPLVEKGLSSTRAATKTNALEALLLYIELDTPAPIIEDLIPSLSNKQPKIVAATLAALTSIYHAYGCKTADPKPVLKALPKVFGHADKNVRAEAQNVTVELYRWLKEAFKPLLWNDLKPVQQQDLDALFEKVKQDHPPKQERLLRSQQAAAEAAQGEAADEIEAEVDEEEKAEALDIFDPVDAMGKVPKDLQERLASTKWKDRKEALDDLFVAVNVPRIQDNDYGEIVRSLAKCMKDANIAVVTVAANCVEVLAKGLRRGSGKYRSIIMSPMMERLKEKKQAVADALGAAMDAVFAWTSFSDCLEETLEFLKHKNPQVKLESVRFLIRSLRSTREVPSKAEIKLICDAATKLLTESSEVLRSAAAEVMGTLMKILGERAMGPYLEGLDDIRKTKIREYCETAQVRAKEKPKPASAAPVGSKASTTGAGAKKVVTKKAVAGLKKTAPSTAPPDEAASAPLQPKLTARNVPSKLTGPPKSGISAPSGGLKLQRKLAGPGGAAPPNISSPKRAPLQPPVSADDDGSAPAPKFGAPGRGLAGRPLGKPALAATTSEASVHTASTPSSTLSAAERAELEELRAARDHLQRTNEDLRSERSKLHSQIHELQHQNAQLIEDHTRDVLSIKAKETQLVRARSDAEAAEQMCHRLQREMDRLKRELGRSVRAGSPTSSPTGSGGGDGIYRDGSGSTILNGGSQGGSSFSANHGLPPTGAVQRPSFTSTLSEEKENVSDPDGPGYGGGLRAKMTSPPFSTTSTSSALSSGTVTDGGRRSPGSRRDGSRGRVESGGGTANVNANGDAGAGGGIESWKRAAEVTSQLKARIELMKARQGFAK